MKARWILFSLMMIGLPVRGADEKIFEGEIADSQCATNVHSLTRSHKEMIDMGSAGKTPADCANYCVKSRGGKYVLQTKQDMYKLDSQDLAEKSAGRKVKVTGTLDPKTNIIQVRAIDPMPSK
jgi:Protein of unknown function (DUF5818)